MRLHDQRRQAERRLVEQQQPRPRHQRAADRHHLLLAARQRAGGLRRACPAAPGTARSTRSSDARAAPCARAAGSCRARGSRARVMPVNSRRPFGHDGDAGARRSDAPAARDVARRRSAMRPARARCMPAIALISVRLAGAVRADHAHQLAGADVERHAPQRRRRAVGDLEVARPQACAVAQVGAHHLRPLHHLGRPALGEQLAVVEHDDAVGQRHHRAHHVLDEHDGRALVADAPDQRDRARRSRPASGPTAPRRAARAAAARRARAPARGTCAGAGSGRPAAHPRLAARPVNSQPVPAPRARLRARSSAAPPNIAAQRDVLAAPSGARTAAGSGRCARCRRARCGARAAASVAAVEAIAAAVGAVMAADDVDEASTCPSRSARAGRGSRRWRTSSVDAGERLHALERLAHAAHCQQRRPRRCAGRRFDWRGGHPQAPAPRRRRRGPARARAATRGRPGRGSPPA